MVDEDDFIYGNYENEVSKLFSSFFLHLNELVNTITNPSTKTLNARRWLWKCAQTV